MTEKWRLCSDIIGNLTIKGENQSIGRFIKLEDKQCQEIVDLLNEQDKELENSKKQLKRVYNYFMDYLEDEMSSESFSEMWDFVITDEKWD